MALHSINQKSIRLLLLVLGAVSLIFILLFWGVYQIQLRSERSQASTSVNLLLQASLENAMLKRDLSGLKAIIRRLGQQDGILNVVILNPQGEVRFAGVEQGIGKTFEQPLSALCPGCDDSANKAAVWSHFITRADGKRVLRSVNPVKNKQSCTQCHGPIETNAVNGILVVDYDAEPIFRKARIGVLWLGLAGMIVLLVMAAAVWRFMNRHVIKPVAHLRDMSEKLAQGDLKARVSIQSQDEFELLGKSFNTMAERLDKSLHQLMDKEEYLQALIDAIPDGIRVIDAQSYKVVHSNIAYKEQLGIDDGVSEQALCYRNSHQKDEPCPAALVTCPLHEIAQTPEPVKTMQRFKRVDGAEFDVQVFAAPLKTARGHKAQVVESIRNLTDDIRFSHEQKLSAVGQLATGVAHEIHNPLTSIRMALKGSLTKLDAGADNIDEISDYLRLVDGEIDKCIDVTRRLLQLSSFGSEKMDLVDVNIAAKETLSLLKYEAEQKNIRMRLDLSEEAPRMLASNQDIRMLILNLAQNAFHSMPDGGEMKISTRMESNEIFLDVCDTGVGIKPEHLSHIFEPFFSERADSNHGTGLGLTICQSIVQRYDGEIEAQDVRPHGACFKVSLKCPECDDEDDDER